MEIALALLVGFAALAFALMVAVLAVRRDGQRRDLHLARLALPLVLHGARGQRERTALWYWGLHRDRPVGISIWAHKGYQGADDMVDGPVMLTSVVVGARGRLPESAVLWRREPATRAGRPATSRELDEAFDLVGGVDLLPPAVIDAALDFVHRWPSLRLRPLDAAWRDRLPPGWPTDQGAVLVMTDLRGDRIEPTVLTAALEDLHGLATAVEAVVSLPQGGGPTQ